jgi:ATP-dependent DNA helicase RecG
VALLAMARAVETGAQAALMAPTEVLARQHLATIRPLAERAGLCVAILTGREKGRERTAVLEGLASGTVQIVIGTHALFQEAVTFSDLGFVVVDEQHRFGVHQRLAITAKGDVPDMLVMTATPIPRTLVLSAFGDMDVSRLTEKPPGRLPIRTVTLPFERLDELVGRIADALADGGKAYWICPLVEESEEADLTSAQERHATLARRFGAQVGLVHGRMPGREKDEAMADFKEGRTRLLVATTVVEVGVDVPDATIIVIEHAERFGLAQLHQLRGRVGRGAGTSSCVLLYKPPLSQTAAARLSILRETEDGFRIAEEDLKLRGEGELLGTRQSGTPGFRVARLDLHADLLETARDDARLLLVRDPTLTSPRGEAVRTLLYLFGRDEAVRLLSAG